MKNLLIYTTTFFMISCYNKEPKEYLEFFYMGPNINTPISYPCNMISEDILGSEINYKKVIDKQKITEFINLYDEYVIINDSTSINTRIKVLIHKNSKTDTLCLGEFFNTYKNGVKVKDNSKLLKYVKEVIDYENTISTFEKKHKNILKNQH